MHSRPKLPNDSKLIHWQAETNFCTQIQEISAWQITCELTNLKFKKLNFCFFSFSSFTIDFKTCLYDRYYNTPGFHIEYFDDTLPILKNLDILL